MESSTSQSPAKSPARQSLRGTFYYLQVAISVAFVLATMFTAWTPASLLPGSLTEKLSEALAPIAATPPVEYPTPTPRPRPLIGIVVGHWDDSNDPGAVCSDGLTEFQINQDVATRVMKNLVDQGFDVDLLKEFDPRLNGYRALALISIHADSCDYVNDDATGFKLAAALSSQYPEKANRLTSCIRNRYIENTGMKYHSQSVTADMTSYHAFNEINSDTTAVIIEVGFLNLDRQILTQHQDLIAKGISDGILCYVRNEDNPQPDQP
ncbi:MAG: N-acetylmuramoyl-L-alanine amidase [Anaerolineales bacterium]|jgi:N-acetylmuramoyl-L-alanine amidase